MKMSSNDGKAIEAKKKLYDVFLGRGDGVAKKHGNVLYRKMIKKNKNSYRCACGNRAKNQVAKSIMNNFKNNGGTFYSKADNGMWTRSPESTVLSKVKQALREPEKEMKRKIFFEKENKSALAKMDEKTVERLMALIPNSNFNAYKNEYAGDMSFQYPKPDPSCSITTENSNRSNQLTNHSSSTSSRVSALFHPSEDETSINFNRPNIGNTDVIEPIQLTDPLFSQSLYVDGIYNQFDQESEDNTNRRGGYTKFRERNLSNDDWNILDSFLDKHQPSLPDEEKKLKNDELCSLSSLDNMYSSSMLISTPQRERAHSA